VAFLSSLVSPLTSVVAVYHEDIPLVLPPSFSQYEPSPVTVLTQVATAVLRNRSIYQVVEEQRARNRSLAEPRWGLREGKEGVLAGVKRDATGAGTGEMVLDMEIRRKSGRAVTETFVLAFHLPPGLGDVKPVGIALLSDHSAFAASAEAQAGVATKDADVEADTTFNLGLTEKQRLDRDGVVLPYFDAQTDVGSGEGGRILYEMGREDDFDDEEDEI
jgi:elongator complex protein 5